MHVVDPSTELKGKTNFVIVDRNNLFEDALAEISLIDNLRLPLEVNFMGENFAEQYYISGIIMGLCVLQNGKIPTFLSEKQFQDLVDDSLEHSPCMVNLQNGLHKVGVLQLMAKLPVFLYLFRSSDSRLNVRNLVHLLEPKFAEEGSNTKRYQKEVASGRRVRHVGGGVRRVRTNPL